MKSISDYIDDARRHSKLHSNNAVARALGINNNNITKYHRSHGLPGDEVMIKLAVLGGNDPFEALLDLNYWRTKGTDAETYYIKMHDNIHKAMEGIAA
ncbi:hypothetical protein L6172_09800 [Thalassospiraceae bacterium SW-3-3]|nr:hypothetical protein L6172_09800 [Thalassospiraceae bacterium SW-3-3]